MKVYKYKDYKEYVNCQKEANIKKGSNVWAVEKNIKFLAEYLSQFNPTSGLCHGVRQGVEVDWFNKYLKDCKTIGTEIGEIKPAYIIQWDFNKVNLKWLDCFDFIYSNSFDHAYDPVGTLNVWFDQLKKGGCILLEYDKRQEHTGEISKKCNKTDPVSITVDELINKIPTWIPGSEVKVLDMPVIKIEFQKTIVVRKI